MRLLSVIIPSYNTELYLRRCLDSLLYDKSVLDKLDIIIVNDGSSDCTPMIAKQYQERFPETVTVINKENGGHGSTINAGLKIAKGKYIKIIDSDDWVNVFAFGSFVKDLAKYDDDIIITNYQKVILYEAQTINFAFHHGESKSYPISQAEKMVDDEQFFFMFSMHSMAIKASSLKKVWGDGLLEKTFYVDQQFAVKVLECAKTFRLVDYDIYRYFIGRPEQSVSVAGFYKHRQDHERVVRWVLSELKTAKKSYLVAVMQKQVELMLCTHYELYYVTLNAKREELAELIAFDTFLQVNYPEIQQKIAAAQNLRRRLSPSRRYIKRLMLERL